MTTFPEGYEFLQGCRVVPVMVVNELAHAVPLARALVAGGLHCLEITLRTPCALDAIAAIRAEVSDATVGAGTVLNPAQMANARAAGAQFIVSPGATPALLRDSADKGVALLPGAVTASEVMAALDHGFHLLKFFPAETSGGAPAIKALGGPFAGVRFMPTGGISLENLHTYLALPNVVAAGGSWMLPADVIAAGDWETLEILARQTIVAAQYQH